MALFKTGVVISGDAKGGVRAFTDAGQASERFTKSVGSGRLIAQQYERQINSLANQLRGLIGVVSVGLVTRETISTIAGFEQSIAGVRAVTGATVEQLAAMSSTARELGASTRFSASEAAEGMRFLGMAGFETNAIIASMPAVLNLATAAQLDLGSAADITSNIMSAFGIQAERSTEIADALAVAAASANTDVRQMGDAMKYVGPVAAGLKISMQDSAAAIGALSNAGIQGTSAGTGLRRILSELVSPSKQAAQALAELGLTADQVNPKTNSLIDIITRLRDSGISAEQAFTIFGDRGAPAILALTTMVPDLERLTGKINDSAGAADRMAEVLGDTLTGDMLAFKSAVQEVMLSIGDSGLKAALREVVQDSTGFIRFISGASEEAQRTRDSMMALGIGIGTLMIATRVGPAINVLTASMYGQAAAALAARNVSLGAGIALQTYSARAIAATAATRGLAGAMALLGGPAGLAILAGAGIYYLTTRQTEAEQQTKRLREQLDGLGDTLSRLDDMSKRTMLMDTQNALDAISGKIAEAEVALDNLLSMPRQAGRGDGSAWLAQEMAIDNQRAKIEKLVAERRSLIEQEQRIAGSLLPATTAATKSASEATDALGSSTRTATGDLKAFNAALKDHAKALMAADAAALDQAIAVSDLQRQLELMRRGLSAQEAQYQVERERLVVAARYQELLGDITAAEITRGKIVELDLKKQIAGMKEVAKATDASSEQQLRAWERVADGVEDAWRTVFRSSLRGFEGFKDELIRGAEDLIVELALVLARQQLIIPVTLGIGSALGLSQTALGSLQGALGLGNSPLAGVFGAAGGAQFGAAAVDAIGQGVWNLGGMLGSATVDGIGVAIQTNASTIAGALVPAIGAGFALFSLGSALATPGGRLGSTNTGIASVLAPAFALPLAGLDRLSGGNVFGTKWKTDGQALLLQVVDDMIDATVETYRSRKRSFGGGTKRSTEVDEALALDAQLGEAFGVIYDSIIDGAESIGLAAGRFSFAIKESLAGLSEDQIQEVIQGALTEATEALIRSTIPRIDEFRQRGEELTQTFQRVVGGVQVLNDAVAMFGLDTTVRQSVNDAAAGIQRIYAVYFTGIPTAEGYAAALDRINPRVQASAAVMLQVADELTRLAGGAQQLQQNVGRFFEQFASDETKIARTAQLTQELFDSIGLGVPALREEVYALIDGIDIFSAAGREAFNALTAGSDLLNAYYANLERDASEAARVAQEAADLAQRAQMERLGLEQRLAAASGDAALAEQVRLALLDQQRWALDETNRALFDMVVAAETAAAALSVQVQLGIVSSIDVLSSSLSSLGLNAQAMIAAAQGGSVALATYVASLNLSTDAMASLASVAAELVRVASTADAEISRSVSVSYSPGGYSAPARDTATDDRLRLERELLMLLGDTAELRRRELQGLSASNKALQLRIWAIEDERVAMQTAESALRDAFDFESRMLKEAAERFRAFGDGLREFAADLRTGPQAMLTPEQQYAALRDQFAQTSALAAAGDEAALQSLAGISRDFLDASRSMFASGDQYFRDFAEVESAALAGAGAADFEVEINERQLEAMQTQVGALVDLNTTMKSLQEAIRDFIKASGDAQSAGSNNSFAELIELTRAGVRLNTQQQKALNESIQELSQRLKLATV